MTSLDVIIPTFNNLAELRACLAALSATDLEVRALVCIDGSTDGTREFLESATFPFELAVLEHPERSNHGRAATRNLALPALKAPFVLLLDSDMDMAPGALRRHVELLNNRRCASIGRVIYTNARENLWARYLMTRGANKCASGSEVRPLDFVTANSAMRTEDLLAVCGFDDTMSGYGGEDTDLALKLHLRGVPFLFNGAAVASSVEMKSVEEGLRELENYAATNLRTTRARHPELPAPYLVDRLESQTFADRAFVALLNPLTDLVVGVAMRIPWFPLRRRLLNYKVLRAIYRGYRRGGS